MKAIILAAGRGSRMGAMTESHPKCLTKVKGKSLIEYQIESLSASGIQNIALVTGYKAEMLENYGTHHFHNSKWAETTMIASLLCAKEWLDQDDCIISYSDIFYDSQIIKDLIDCQNNIAVAYDPNWLELWTRRFKNPLDDAETFRIDNQGYIMEIGQKAKSIEEIQGQYMGLLKFSKGQVNEILNKIEDIPLSTIDFTSFLGLLLSRYTKIKGVENFQEWGEIDSQGDLEQYREEVKIRV
jgi:choline kinase